MNEYLSADLSRTATMTDSRTRAEPTKRVPSQRQGRAALRGHSIQAERYLSIPELAERLGTTERFPRRLIEERRIEYKKFGNHVRVAESVLEAYIQSCTVSARPKACRTTGRR
jgi:excisionase family DNA binding protein